MCGILGVVSKQKESKEFDIMLDTISHRGRDDRGVYIENIDDRYIHFGHNRLSIQDTTTKASQPFISS